MYEVDGRQSIPDLNLYNMSKVRISWRILKIDSENIFNNDTLKQLRRPPSRSLLHLIVVSELFEFRCENVSKENKLVY